MAVKAALAGPRDGGRLERATEDRVGAWLNQDLDGFFAATPVLGLYARAHPRAGDLAAARALYKAIASDGRAPLLVGLGPLGEPSSVAVSRPDSSGGDRRARHRAGALRALMAQGYGATNVTETIKGVVYDVWAKPTPKARTPRLRKVTP